MMFFAERILLEPEVQKILRAVDDAVREQACEAIPQMQRDLSHGSLYLDSALSSSPSTPLVHAGMVRSHADQPEDDESQEELGFMRKLLRETSEDTGMAHGEALFPTSLGMAVSDAFYSRTPDREIFHSESKFFVFPLQVGTPGVQSALLALLPAS